MFFILHNDACSLSIPHHGHSHGNGHHGHSHGHENHEHESIVVDVVPGHSHEENNKSTKNINIQAAMIHVIGDFVQSIGVLLAAILIKIKVCSV